LLITENPENTQQILTLAHKSISAHYPLLPKQAFFKLGLEKLFPMTGIFSEGKTRVSKSCVSEHMEIVFLCIEGNLT